MEMREIVRDGIMWNLDTFVSRAESPIERMMLWGLISDSSHVVTNYVEAWDAPGFVHVKEPMQYVARIGNCECCRIEVLPQCHVNVPGGKFRIDIALRYLHAEGGHKPTWIAVECDGHDFHERTKEQAERDKARDRELQMLGWEVARFTGSEIVRDTIGVVEDLLRFCHGIHVRRSRAA